MASKIDLIFVKEFEDFFFISIFFRIVDNKQFSNLVCMQSVSYLIENVNIIINICNKVLLITK